MCGIHCKRYHRKNGCEKSDFIHHTYHDHICVRWGIWFRCTFRYGTDRNDHDETGRISIQNDPCDHLYRSHLFCNDSLCDQYHQYYACTVSWDFHGLCTNPRMGCIPCILWDRLLLHGSRSKKAAVKEGTAIDESKPVKITPTREDLPAFWIALIPFILVVALVLGFSNLTDMNTNAVVVLSMFIGSLAIVVFCHKQIGAVAKILEKGVNNGIGATVMAAAILGFSGVLQACPGFQSIIEFVMDLKMNPYLI